jgi:WhiB family redox-sensing transcriptional regulator
LTVQLEIYGRRLEWLSAPDAHPPEVVVIRRVNGRQRWLRQPVGCPPEIPTAGGNEGVQRHAAGLSWRDLANCRGVDTAVFFPERGTSTAPAKRICAECVVRTACLEFALADPETQGIFGGTSVAERRQMRGGRPAGPEAVSA